MCGRMRSVSDVFWSLHSGLPRQAPGSDRTTRAMLDVLGAFPGQRAVDVGCGPGRSALALAAAGLDVLAVDTHQPFLDELEVAARAAGLADRVHTRNLPMQALPVDAGVLDVVWSEGAAYLMGFGEALTSWSRLLRPGGGMGLTECCWLTDQPSPETAEFWRQAYPSMRTVPQTVELIEARGLQVLAHWTLPDSDWEHEYYGPLRQRIEALPPEQRADDGICGTQRELGLRAAHPDDYGYVAFVLRLTQVRRSRSAPGEGLDDGSEGVHRILEDGEVGEPVPLSLLAHLGDDVVGAADQQLGRLQQLVDAELDLRKLLLPTLDLSARVVRDGHLLDQHLGFHPASPVGGVLDEVGHPFVHGLRVEQAKRPRRMSPRVDQAGETDDIGVLRREAQDPVTVSADQQRQARGVRRRRRGHGVASSSDLGDGLFELVDALVGWVPRQAGLVELRLHVPGPETEFQPAVEQLGRGHDVAGEQCGPVEAGVEHKGAHPAALGRLGRGHHGR